MSGNSFGERFIVTTFGESHGDGIGGIIDGCPAGLTLDMDLIASELAKRRGTDEPYTTGRKESDEIEWLSGILDGKTLGTPIAFLIRNRDVSSEDYEGLKDWMRAGHADYTYQAKYGIRDWRGGGRASGRETAARVVAGAIARQILSNEGITITSQALMPENMKEGENYGGEVVCHIEGVKAGVGEPVFHKLNASLAYAMMSIPSAISYETGLGKEGCALPRSQWVDQWQERGEGRELTVTNHCGGIQGGISNGMPIEFRVGFHAPATQRETQCRNEKGEVRTITIEGRHDRCHIQRAAAVVEAMAALTLINFAR